MCYQVADAVELVVGVCSETPDLVYSIGYVLRWYSDGPWGLQFSRWQNGLRATKEDQCSCGGEET